MAFNGTKTFPGNTLTEMLARHGVKYGKEVNAYTLLDETVYNVSKVPTKDKKVVDSCLIILRDWSHNLSLEDKEIDAERGVIQEEWRQQYNFASRIRSQLSNVRYNGSIYSKRDVLGSMDIVRTFKPEELRSFYQDWYRPDLQAIGIVGDVDVDAVEQKIKELFAEIKPLANAKPRTYATIPDNDKPLYAVAREAQLNDFKINFEIRFPNKEDNSLAKLRESYVINIFNSLMANRFKEWEAKNSNSPLKGTVSYSDFVKNYKVFRVTAQAKDNKMLDQALTMAFSELDRVARFGFTQAELLRIKTNLLVDAENKSNYNQSNKSDSDVYCKLLKSAFFEGMAVPDAEFSYQFAKEIIPTITNEELIQFAKKYLTQKNRVYTISSPAKKGLELLDANQIDAIIAKVQASNLEPNAEEEYFNKPLIASLPKAGKIVSEKALDKFDSQEWILSNGAKIIYKKGTYDKGNILINAVSPGGYAVYPIEKLPSAQATAKFVDFFGLGDFDPLSLKKILTGKTVETSFSIGETTESVMGKSTTKDLETMMQLVYLRFAQPRFDRVKFDDYIKHYYEEVVANSKRVPALKDTLNAIITKGDSRILKVDKAYIDAINFDTMQKIYKERFENAGDFTFYIIGDVDAAVLKPLVEKYIDALPGNSTKETRMPREPFFPKGKTKQRVYLPMSQPKAALFIKMQADGEYNRTNIIDHVIFGEILKIRLLSSIREKEGAAYTINVTANSTRLPSVKLNMEITFNCDPEKAEYLNTLVYKEIDAMKKKVTQEELNMVVTNLDKNTESQNESNNYWLVVLRNYLDYNEDMTSSKYIRDVLKTVSVKDIEKTAKKYIKKANITDVVFYPKAVGASAKKQ